MVQNNYKRGNEIGSHSVNHINVDTAGKLEFEAGQQKENLINNGGVGRSNVVGWRSPNLQTAGDSQPDVLKSLNYTYDISLTYTRQTNNRVPWPYTLDFGYPYLCSIPPCPQSSHPSFWKIPVVSLMDPESGFPCAYVDSCRLSSEAAALNFLWTNFEQVYNNNRAPFGLNMHAAWFFFDDYIKATHAFLDKLLQLDDVYIISAQKALDWMRNPMNASEIPSKMPSWGCANPLPISSTFQGPTKKPYMGNVFPQLMTSTPPKPSPTASPTTTTRHPGLRQVPLVLLLDTRKEYTCSFVDACTQNQPRTAEETYKYLLENFDFNYNQNRAPFGVNLRGDWLTHPCYAANLKGLAMFPDTLLQERAGVTSCR